MALPDPAADSTALVTGASSGIGEAIARELAERGHGLTLVARREQRLRELGAELSGAGGVRTEVISADLGEAAERDRVASRVEELGLTVDILVNNAGFGSADDVARADRERLVEMVRVNCEALLDLQVRYLREMVDRGRGAVINIASTAAFQPIPGTATYAATKAFVLSLSEATHAEVSRDGVTVTAVCPGPVKTEFVGAAGLAAAEDNLPGMFWTDVADVAREAVDGAAKNRRVVVPGLMNRAGAITGQHAPRALALPFIKRVWQRST
ncbi:MAG: SDR family NAD(P)-dependent oxidoreductase [Solirubrobacterales bacterium]